MQLEATINYTWREDENRNNGSYPSAFNNRSALVVPAEHPANPFGIEVGPHLWRPHGRQLPWPSFWDGEANRQQTETTTVGRYKVGGTYDFNNSWSAYSYISTQRLREDRDHSLIHMDRLQAGLIGQGGPSGQEWYNPFGSADPRSPFHVEGVTDNPQALVDYVYASFYDIPNDSQDLDIFELTATGNVFGLPYGEVAMATGVQYRDSEQGTFNDPLSLAGNSYNSSLADSVPTNESYGREVYAGFVEVEVPILDTLAAQIAVRHENFTTFNLSTTTPKIAVRWEATPELAIRASWGESFLAPSAIAARPFDPSENCGEIFTGNDPLTGGTLQGGTSCSSGNPDLQPETSDIWNAGFTWEPIDDLSISLDYQSIEYSDQIRTASNQDVARNEFRAMLEATGISEANYDPTPGSSTREAANAWVAAQGDQRVTRDPQTQRVTRVVRQSQNVNTVWVDLFDARARHTWLTDNLGTFTTSLSGTYYTKYEYQSGTEGAARDALGLQNANTGIVPPMPEFKGSFRVNWFRDNHSASMNTSYMSSVTFDATPRNLLTGTPAPASGEVRAWHETDVQYSYLLDQYFDSEINVSVGVRNLFDKLPQRLPVVGGMESRLHTPWGRQFWASIDLTF